MRRYKTSIQQLFRADLFPPELDPLRFSRSQTSLLYVPSTMLAVPACTLGYNKEALGTDGNSVPEPLAQHCVHVNIQLRAENVELREDNLCLGALLEQAEAERDDAKQECDRAMQDAERHKKENRRLKYELDHKRGASSSLESGDPSRPTKVDSIEEAIEQACRWLPHLAIPEAASERLPTSSQSGWADWVWQVLQFLNEYAEARPHGSVFEWNRSGESQFDVGGRYALAMQESETVKNRNKTGSNRSGKDNRWFQVDKRVADTGIMPMFAHFKQGTKRGSQMLRIYFHDDAKGVTGKMHIGYIGDHLDTERTN